jgi:Family of unknown function (DUF5343)
MANREKKSFPQFPVKNWWALRKKFKQSIPGTVTPNYLASVLGMRENSARDNVYLYLKLMKIVDQDGKPMPRATKWRDDHNYPKVCETIVKELYPQELIDAVPDPKKDKDAATRWFANHTGAGEISISKMVACYTVLCSGDASQAPEQGDKKSKSKKQSITKKKTPSTSNKTSHPKEKVEHSAPKINGNERRTSPEIYINLQVHISSDSSNDQIEQIFASMAKHIYRK